MKDTTLVEQKPEHSYAKASSSASNVVKKNQDHGYAKSSSLSLKKHKKHQIIDPKQRKLSFSKLPAKPKIQEVTLSSSSDSDEPLSSVKNSNDSSSPVGKMKLLTFTKKSPIKPTLIAKKVVEGQNDVSFKNKAKDGTSPKVHRKKKREKSPSSKGKEKKKEGKTKLKILSSSKAKGDSSPKKAKKLKSPKKKSSTKENKTNGVLSSSKKVKIDLSSDSDSDLDIPLSQLKNSPKFKNSPKIKVTPKLSSKHGLSLHKKGGSSASAMALKVLSQVQRSPKVKISTVKSPKLKLKMAGDKGMKQKTLFDFGTKSTKEPIFPKERMRTVGQLKLSDMQDFTEKIDWKTLTEEEKEKIRLQKREEWNKIRRERNRLLNQKYDDLELTNIAPLPAAKPIILQGGLPNNAFGEIAMMIEFIYTFNKFLAPEESPTISAELLIKALAAGSQGADVVSKILLVFLRALIGEEEQEINGLGIGLADMPLTVFTVSELVYHYLKLTCDKQSKEQGNKGDKGDEDKKDEEQKDDDDDDASSIGSAEEGKVEKEEMPKRIIASLENKEFYTLSATDQLKVMIFLFHKIIDSDYYMEYLESLKMETKELWRQQDALRKKAAEERKKELQKNIENKAPEGCNSMTIDQFAKKIVAKTEAQLSAEKQAAGSAEVKAEDSKSEVGSSEPKTENREDKENLTDQKKVDSMKQKEASEKRETKEEKVEVVLSKDLGAKADDEIMKDYPKEPVTDLVHIVRQRRVMAAKQAALRDEEEKKEKERRKLQEEMQHKLKKIQAWKDGLDRCKRSLRLDPIGTDRHFKLYWVFCAGMPGIYVEDGWMYHAGEKRTIDSWEMYDTIEDVDKLMKALARQGERESALKGAIAGQYKAITSFIKKKLPEHSELKPYNTFEESIKILKEDLLESGTKIVKGVLGMISNQEAWEKRVEEGKTLEDMVPLLLDLQQSVLPKFLQGTMDQSKGEEVVKNWRENVKNAKTMSALHTLLGILENSVKWDKSAENIKCKICRRKAGDDYVVLCDECNRGYHPYCLRPALVDFPSESWKCPACAPTAPTSSRTRKKPDPVDYYDGTQDEESADDTEEEEEKEEADGTEESDHESLCHVCGEDGELICCDQCPKVYHLDCHEPPIRRLPRGVWICFVCRNPRAFSRSQRTRDQQAKTSKQKSKSTKGKKKAGRGSKKLSRRGRRSDPIEEEDEEDGGNGSESEGGSEGQTDASEERPRGSKKRQAKNRRRKQDTATEESEEEEEAPRAKRSKRGSGSNSRGKKRNSNTGDESSDPSPKSRRKRSRKNVSEDESENDTSRKARKRNSKSRKQNNVSENESDEVSTSKRRSVTRKRKVDNIEKAGEEEEEKAGGKKRKSERGSKGGESRDSGNSADLSFGRRSRNRNRGQNSEIVACENILRGMWRSRNSFHFKNPVDHKKVPDYDKLVANPIDLSTIRNKLDTLEYEDAFQFVDDVKLLFSNAKNYNEDTSEVGQEARELEAEFFELLKKQLSGLHSSICGDS